MAIKTRLWYMYEKRIKENTICLTHNILQPFLDMLWLWTQRLSQKGLSLEKEPVTEHHSPRHSQTLLTVRDHLWVGSKTDYDTVFKMFILFNVL